MEIFSDLRSVTTLAVGVIILWWSWMIVTLAGLRPGKTTKKVVGFTGTLIGRKVKQKELDYIRDNEIGLIKRGSNKHKFHTLLNDLTIDLGLKTKGATPYELLFFMLMMTFVVSLSFTILLKSVMFGLMSFPVIFFAVLCTAYTKANSSHAARIGAIIEAENIICNNISSGVKVAVRGSLNSFPKEVKDEFKDYLNELDDNTHPVDALRHLNDKLGSVSDSFIQKCMQFELNAEHGTADTFQDIVEMNSYMTTVRIKMERVFEDITNEFMICLAIIGVFFVGVLSIYPFIRSLYFETVIGRMLILIDLFLIVVYFVIITASRAKNYFGE